MTSGMEISHDGMVLTVTVPLTLRTRGGRKLVISPSGETMSFARKGVTARDIPIKSALIDSASSRFQNGSNIYISRIIRESLAEEERVLISYAHRKLREAFMRDKNLEVTRTPSPPA